MAFPKVGNLAPAFSLLDQDGNKVALKDFRDKKNVENTCLGYLSW